MNESEKRPESQGRLRTSLQSRAFRVGGYSVIAVAVVLAIVVVINVIVTALPSSWTQLDATSSQLFSISGQTENVLAGLDQDVDVYWVVRTGDEDEYMESLLDRYASMSDHVKINKLDPDVYPTFLTAYGQEESPYDNSLLVVCGDYYRYVDYYDIFTYEIDYSAYYTTGSYTYDISFDGESQLTSAISYVSSGIMPKLYTLTGHGEIELSDSFASAITGENFQIEELSLVTTGSVPEDADAVLIYAPTSDLSTDDVEALREYLQAGGDLILVTQPPDGEPLSNLEGLMADYGVTAEEGLVVEEDVYYYASGYGPAYLLPEINSHTITDPLIEGGYYVLLPIAQGLTVSDNLPDNVSVTEILTTSSSAISKIDGYNLTTYDKEDGDIDGPFAVGVAITDYIDDDTTSNIVWVSSAYLLDDTASLLVAGGNEDLVLNTLNWMSDQDNSISIHAKSLNAEYLTIDSGTGTFLIALFVAIIPLAYMAVGIILWVRRRHR